MGHDVGTPSGPRTPRALPALTGIALLLALALTACVPASTGTDAAETGGSAGGDSAGGDSASIADEDAAAVDDDASIPTPAEARHERAEAIVDAMTPRERAASVLMSTRSGTSAKRIGSFVKKNGLGGFILMGGNVPADPDELREITAAATPDPSFPPLLAVDEEGGIVSRLPWDDLPAADTLKDEPAKRTKAAFRARTELLSEAGINVNFGIVADVPGSESSFIFERALGRTPKASAARVAAAVAGAHAAPSGDGQGFVASTLKHFPGHGAAEGDSHIGVPSTGISLKQWRKTHAPPFRAGIEAGAELLMVGHLAYTAVDEKPASLSKRWHRIARDELGFEGVIVSDDLGMLLSSGVPAYANIAKDVVRSLAAGTDLALVIQGIDDRSISDIIDAVEAAVDSGRLPASRLHDAATRVAELRLRIGEAAANG